MVNLKTIGYSEMVLPMADFVCKSCAASWMTTAEEFATMTRELLQWSLESSAYRQVEFTSNHALPRVNIEILLIQVNPERLRGFGTELMGVSLGKIEWEDNYKQGFIGPYN